LGGVGHQGVNAHRLVGARTPRDEGRDVAGIEGVFGVEDGIGVGFQIAPVGERCVPRGFI
jgi:hypothetical protein